MKLSDFITIEDNLLLTINNKTISYYQTNINIEDLLYDLLNNLNSSSFINLMDNSLNTILLINDKGTSLFHKNKDIEKVSHNDLMEIYSEYIKNVTNLFKKYLEMLDESSQIQFLDICLNHLSQDNSSRLLLKPFESCFRLMKDFSIGKLSINSLKKDVLLLALIDSYPSYFKDYKLDIEVIVNNQGVENIETFSTNLIFYERLSSYGICSQSDAPTLLDFSQAGIKNFISLYYDNSCSVLPENSFYIGYKALIKDSSKDNCSSKLIASLTDILDEILAKNTLSSKDFYLFRLLCLLNSNSKNNLFNIYKKHLDSLFHIQNGTIDINLNSLVFLILIKPYINDINDINETNKPVIQFSPLLNRPLILYKFIDLFLSGTFNNEVHLKEFTENIKTLIEDTPISYLLDIFKDFKCLDDSFLTTNPSFKFTIITNFQNADRLLEVLIDDIFYKPEDSKEESILNFQKSLMDFDLKNKSRKISRINKF